MTAQAAHRNAPNGSSAKSRGRRMMDQSRIRGRRNYSHVSEKNLYQPHNIIGQTNTKTGYPTTYYHNSYTRGRVTTRHENPDNVGRESPRTDKNYYMLHRPHRKDASRPQMIETILDSDGVAEPIHHSRTGLVQAKSTKEQDLMHKTTEYYQYPKKNRGEE
ncbi:hypothetical protein [Agarilytica rhodophyticola]|uniref:hypothetical protein n=1 Tax=Agarilytica rhodophyticola TaxID=1737490 RepID=UPI000B349977|nr:hypothetical protein [Agarilytica rhodophyticola]